MEEKMDDLKKISEKAKNINNEKIAIFNLFFFLF